MSETPIELLRARLWATETFPYFGAALWALTFREDEGMASPIAIDKRWRIIYNPKIIAKFDKAELGTSLAHEVSHVIRKHHERIGEREQLKWNVATDLSINTDLAPGRLPVGCLLPAMFKLTNGLTAEEYYDQLPPGKVKQVGVDCGSGCHGKGNENEEGGEDDESVSTVRGELIRRQVAEDIKAAKQRGNVPAGLARWADDLLEPKADWRTVLARVVRGAARVVNGCTDYTYTRPSRRVWPGVVLPKMVGRQPQAAAVVDTSGSMGQSDIERCLAEVRGICRAVGVGWQVFFCDAKVGSVGRAGDKRLREKVTGGGGTDMRVGLEAAMESKPRPDVLVILTDGETPWPNGPLAVPLIVCLIGECAPDAPAWATGIRVG